MAVPTGNPKHFYEGRKVILCPLHARRLVVAALIFMPIYYFFGLLVIPVTRSYYQQNLYGLDIPSIDRMLTILFIRSVLFWVACLF